MDKPTIITKIGQTNDQVTSVKMPRFFNKNDKPMINKAAPIIIDITQNSKVKTQNY